MSILSKHLFCFDWIIQTLVLICLDYPDMFLCLDCLKICFVLPGKSRNVFLSRLSKDFVCFVLYGLSKHLFAWIIQTSVLICLDYPDMFLCLDYPNFCFVLFCQDYPDIFVLFCLDYPDISFDMSGIIHVIYV